MIGELEHRIRERAHRIWEREGCPEDRAQAHWAMASAEIAAEGKSKARPRGKAAAAAEGAKAPAVTSPAAPKRRASKAK